MPELLSEPAANSAYISGLKDFLDLGGLVLWSILFLSILLWTSILNRYWFYYRTYPGMVKALVKEWKERKDVDSWYARKIREAIISHADMKLQQSLTFIKTLIALGPLFGLLGTVSGMIEVFDIMALTGNNDARVMASGISRATITTMAGLLVALTGIYPIMQLNQKVKKELARLAEAL